MADCITTPGRMTPATDIVAVAACSLRRDFEALLDLVIYSASTIIVVHNHIDVMDHTVMDLQHFISQEKRRLGLSK